VVAAVVLAITSLGGSSGKSATSSTAGTVASAGKTRSTAHRRASSKPASKAGSPAANPAETTVAVLNATETTGLAHRISGDLQQGGYSQAQALNGRPPGTGQVSVVEYASGHQAEAEGVARSLSVKKVQPLESAVAALAGSAQVVVIVGADKATTVP
jgi:hypothetical protein